MGTYYRVQVAGEELDDARRAMLEAAVVEELETVDRLMSTYRDDSELSRFNRHRETTPFVFSPPTFEVLSLALDVARASGGAFDVTVGPLVDAWGFGPDGRAIAPSPAELGELRRRVGFDRLVLDPGTRSARKLDAALACDLSAIAKGYAVDRVAERLATLGAASHWVEVGGEVRAAGRNARGEIWRLGIERPQPAPGAVQRIVPLRDLAVATSGDYRNYRELDGARVSHLIDPRDGRPIGHRLASASVFDRRCAVADAWATALMVLGEEEGYELAAGRGLPALLLVREGDGFVERGTPEFWRLAGRPAPARAR